MAIFTRFRCSRSHIAEKRPISDRGTSTRTDVPFAPTGPIAMLALAGSIAVTPAFALGRESEAVQVRSEVKSLAIAPAHDLPRAAATASDRDTCKHLTIAPSTPPGRLVANRGWAVTGEVQLKAGDQAVSFAGKFESGTSGSCVVSQGNVAIFHEETLLAIAYAPRGSKETIGKVLPLADGHARIWSGDFLSQPIADLRVENDGDLLALAPLSAEEKLCDGRAVVPNIYGMPINSARKALESNGWTPVRGAIGTNRDEQSREIDLVERGIPEVDGCSGTGFAFCSFAYRGPAGGLSVTTVGDDGFPSVASYDATCR